MANTPQEALHALRQALNDLETSLQATSNGSLSSNTEDGAQLASLEAEIAALRKQLEDGAQERTYKIALSLTLANAAYDALLVLNENREIIASNTSAEELFGCETPPIGKNVADVTGSPELEMMVIDALDNREEVFEEQVTINQRAYRVRTQVIQREGHSFTALALQDVTELVRLNRARRDMVANISHELRNPIANIRLIIEGLFHEQDKPKRKQSTSALRAIAREADTLMWLAQELLDLSMIESGQAIMRMMDMPARELVDVAVERLIDQSEKKTITIQADIPENLMVLADRDQARRVLVNLLHNALKWSPPNETIQVHAEDIGEEVLFSVLDNGPGVPAEHIDRIFERFYQVDPARTRGEGTGLGLAICKHIVQAHGGQIWAEGNLDAQGNKLGGRFFFTLPSAFGSAGDDLLP
jgi:two-component system, OmpR family, phosphate regulon sensor histidine kinase PhoR